MVENLDFLSKKSKNNFDCFLGSDRRNQNKREAKFYEKTCEKFSKFGEYQLKKINPEVSYSLVSS